MPGVLLLLLSTLGIFFGVLTTAAVVYGFSFQDEASRLPTALTGGLVLLIAGLQVPVFVLSIRSLRGKSTTPVVPSLFKPAMAAGLAWLALLAGGILASRAQAPWPVMVPLTLLAVALPAWWLVEFSRRGLPRSSALREWGSLSIGLSAAPIIIMLAEVLLLLVIALAAVVVLAAQPGMLDQLTNITSGLNLGQGGMQDLEQTLFQLAKNPVIAAALFLMIGVLAPFIEELFKPMAIWFLLKRPLKLHEGFSLGLISGAAFALLESAGLLVQISLDEWAQAVILRAGTGLLHIGLSGLVGYGLVSAWNSKHIGRAFLFMLGAGGLHGAWNSLALLSGLAVSSIPAANADAFQPTPGGLMAVAGMLVVFIAVLLIVLRINKSLRADLEQTKLETTDPSNA